MSRTKILWLKIKTNSYYNIFLKLNDIGINIYDNYKEKNYIFIKTTYADYKRIKKYLVSYDISIDSYEGYYKFKKIIKKYAVFMTGIIISIALLILANNLVFKIEVKTANKNIQKIVLKELEDLGIKRLTLKKSHKKIEKIVKKILEDNKDTLEWLEIKYDGLIMVVNVTEKTIPKKDKVYNNCNIIATKDAKITSLGVYRGVALKEINDYVLKNDVIISGSIMHNEEVKNKVCASGEVYGEVWYKAKITVPFKETYVKYTGKNRFNLNVIINDKKYQIFKSRIANKKEKMLNLYKLNDFSINLIKEKEYVLKTRELTEEDAYKKGINLAEEKIKLQLNDNEEILLKKVLKNEVNDSTIYLEIFIVTKENIGKSVIVEEDVKNDVESDSKSIQ